VQRGISTIGAWVGPALGRGRGCRNPSGIVAHQACGGQGSQHRASTLLYGRVQGDWLISERSAPGEARDGPSHPRPIPRWWRRARGPVAAVGQPRGCRQQHGRCKMGQIALPRQAEATISGSLPSRAASSGSTRWGDSSRPLAGSR
jgi:hypothetical protein